MRLVFRSLAILKNFLDKRRDQFTKLILTKICSAKKKFHLQ